MAGYPNTVKSLFRGGYNVNYMEDLEVYREIVAIDKNTSIQPLFPAIGATQGLPIRERDLLFTIEADNTLSLIRGYSSSSSSSRYEAFNTPGTQNFSKVPVWGSLNGLQQRTAGGSQGDEQQARLNLQKRISFIAVNKKDISADGTTTGFRGGTCSIVNNTPYPWKSQQLGMLRVPTAKEVNESRKYMDQRDQAAKRVVPIIVPVGRSPGELTTLFYTSTPAHMQEVTAEIATPMLDAFNRLLKVSATNPNANVQTLIARKDPSAVALMAAVDMYADERANLACVKFEQDVAPGMAGVVKILA